MSTVSNSLVKNDFSPVNVEKSPKNPENVNKMSAVESYFATAKCLNPKDGADLSSIVKGGCIPPIWNPGKFEDIFSDKQVNYAINLIKNMANASDKGEVAENAKQFYQVIENMDRSDLLEVASFLTEQMKNTDKNDQLFGSLLNGVLDQMKQMEKKPWGEIIPLPKKEPWIVPIGGEGPCFPPIKKEPIIDGPCFPPIKKEPFGKFEEAFGKPVNF